jgi:hypothetical protein
MKIILGQELIKVELSHISAFSKSLSEVLLSRLGRTNHEKYFRKDSAASLFIDGSNTLRGINVTDLSKLLVEINNWLRAIIESLKSFSKGLSIIILSLNGRLRSTGKASFH